MKSISANLVVRSIQKVIGKGPHQLHQPLFLGKEASYLKNTIDQNFVSTAGEYVNKFEKKIKEYTKAKFAVAVVNGTQAIYISLKACGVKKNEEVLVPALTFVGTVNAVKYCDAIPHFVDIDENTLGINVEKLEKYLNKIAKVKNNICINKFTGRKIKAVIPVHVFGHFMKINELKKLARKFKLRVIEDAAEAVGSYLKRKHAGTFGDIGILSFNGNKTITCGSGGAILTNSKKIEKKARHLISTAKIGHPFNYIHDEIGYNYRMPNLNAALGYSQILKIKKILKNKRKLFSFYKKIFNKNLFFKLLNEPKESKSNFWLQTIILKKKYSNFNQKIIKDLIKEKIHVRPGWKLMTDLNYLKKSPKMDISIAKKICSRIINIPSSSFLINYIKK